MMWSKLRKILPIMMFFTVVFCCTDFVIIDICFAIFDLQCWRPTLTNNVVSYRKEDFEKDPNALKTLWPTSQLPTENQCFIHQCKYNISINNHCDRWILTGQQQLMRRMLTNADGCPILLCIICPELKMRCGSTRCADTLVWKSLMQQHCSMISVIIN